MIELEPEIAAGRFSNMRNLPFPYVTVRTAVSGKMRNIGSIEEPLYNWPRAAGARYSAARQACLDALEGKITCTAARDAFIEAAKEADIYVRQQFLKH